MGILAFFGKLIAFFLLGLVVLLVGASAFILAAPNSYEQIKGDMLDVLPGQLSKMGLSEMPEFTMEEFIIACSAPQQDPSIVGVCAKVNSGEITTTDQVKKEFYKILLSEETKKLDQEFKPKIEQIKSYGMYPLMGAISLALVSLLFLRLASNSFLGALKTMCSMIATISLLSVIGLFLMQQYVPPILEKELSKGAFMGSSSEMQPIIEAMAPYLVKWGLMFINPVFYATIGLLVISVIGYLVLWVVLRKPKKEEKEEKEKIKK